MEILFLYVFGIVRISASPKIFFSYFFNIMRIHFSHVLGIAWISASPKPINLKCLCFPRFFLYYGNPLFPCFGNYMDFCFIQIILKTCNFEMFVFSHIFPLLCQFTFPIFLQFYGFLLSLKYL